MGIDSEASWDAAIRGIKIRMALAERRLNTAAQRYTLARAIIVPKLLYVARHAYPSKARRRELQRLLHNYVWGSTCVAPNGRQLRAWLGQEVARLPFKAGGLAMPQIDRELQQLGVRALLRWNSLLLPKTRVATTILLMTTLKADLYVTATGVHCVLRASVCATCPRLGRTLWATGLMALQSGANGAGARGVEGLPRQCRRRLRAGVVA